MILRGNDKYSTEWGKPRASGDDPILKGEIQIVKE